MTIKRSIMAVTAAALIAAGMGAGSTSALVAAGTSVQDQDRTDQGQARRDMRAGNQLSLRQIESRILPQMRGSEYLGPSYDSTARAYRLKFIKDGRVTYVDVDARTGRIINRSN